MSESVTENSAGERPFERRRGRLPQPDFSHYKKENAYPGPNYFFVGHSFNLEESAQVEDFTKQRAKAINDVLPGESKWVPVNSALEDANFAKVLSRFEHDFLHRLDGALIGPAIDGSGQHIIDSFTIWRPEKRRQEREQN